MITKLKLKSGRAPGLAPTEMAVSAVTVFVGPNNSGKSKLLLELDRYCRTGKTLEPRALVDEVHFSGCSREEAESALAKISQAPRPGEAPGSGNMYVGKYGGRHQVPREGILDVLMNPSSNLPQFCQWYLGHSTLTLNGAGRVALVNQQSAGDLQIPPQSSLQALFVNDSKRAEVRRILYEAFGTYFVIDPTMLGQLRIRLSETAPTSVLEERGIHDEAISFHSQAQPIEAGSDGVKAFTGIITELIAGDPRVILIDEPEAFLHPSLASKLGLEIAKAATSADKRVFVSTHSPQFVMGCIQSGAQVNIVRLTYRGGVATSRVLPSNEILELMRNPLLRSTGLLSGLFYEFVVVAESDADRAFYQEVNERLLRQDPEQGIPNCLFLNAQNKQTVSTILKPLRQLGIPAAGIVDIDVLKEGGTPWNNMVSAANIPPLAHQGLAASRVSVKNAMDATGKNMKRDGGISILGASDKEAAETLLKQLDEYGVFVVRTGELESWLKDLGASGHGPAWLVNVFEKMGEDPSAANYLKPGKEDVWKFLGTIRAWLLSAGRKGIPQ